MSSAHGGSRVGTRFGPYDLRSVIGVGGMGEVYRAYDTGKERMVAVKLLRAELAADPKFQERFRRESRVAARLQEPHVIPVHDFGDIDGVLYIEMRLVEGPSLRDLLHHGGPLEPRRAASIITQVASALDAAHADGLVHRDIKPENVLLTPDDFAYLVDFGIAHAGGDASVTMTGMVVGSSAYMAAERFSGNNPPGPASDIYSLACLLFEALTGRPPFDTTDLQQLLGAHMFAPPPRPSVVRPEIPRAFDDVIARGMAKQPADRFPSAAELAKAAIVAAARAVPSHGPPPPSAARPTSTRQFTSLYANPVATGYTPYPPPPPQPTPPPAPVRKGRFGPAQIALAAATILLLGTAAVLAVLLVNGDGGSSAPSRLAVPPTTSPPSEPPLSPSSTTTPPTTTTTTTTTTTSSPTTTTSAGPVRMSGADAQGFVGHSARCDSGSSPAAMIRTAQSLAVICQTGSNDFYYRGERLRDGAALELNGAMPSGGGFDAVNPADGARYQVRPDGLTILSDRGVDSAEPALQYAAERP